jgi:large subunit ribosomal protein L10
MLLGVLQAPSRNLVTVLNAKAASILNVLNAYKDKVEKQQ